MMVGIITACLVLSPGTALNNFAYSDKSTDIENINTELDLFNYFVLLHTV